MSVAVNPARQTATDYMAMLGGGGGVGNGLPGYALATTMLGGGGGVGNGLPGYVLAITKLEHAIKTAITATKRTLAFMTYFSCLEQLRISLTLKV